MHANRDTKEQSTLSDKYQVVKPKEITDKRCLIVVLENCCLETVKTREGNYELLSCDEHIKLLRRMKRDWTEVRPDITHQCLLTLLDSPLNRSGHLQVYLHTNKNVLIQISPLTRIPRTFKRFSGLIVQLLHENRIRASKVDDGTVLMKLVKNPITNHLPLGIKKIACTSEGVARDPCEFLKSTLDPQESVAFFIGAFSKGSDYNEYAEQYVSFSNYPLSASVACGKLCCAMENFWGIL